MPRAPAVLALAALAALGCGHDEKPTPAALGLAAASAVPIPAVALDKLAPPKPRVRVLVTARGLDVDDAAVLDAWPPAERVVFLQSLPADEAAVLPFIHRDLLRFDRWTIAPPDTPSPGSFELRALGDVLAYEGELERKRAQAAGQEATFSHEANVYADGATPYGLIVQVLYTAGMSEFTPVPIARGPKGEVALPLEVPRIGGQSCATPSLTIDASGISVRMIGGAALVGAPDGPMVQWVDHACPSSPRREGALDLPRLGALLREIGHALPASTCGLAQISASPETPWREVVAVAEAASLSGFTSFRLAIARLSAPGSAPACAGAITADHLRDEDFPGGYR